MIKKKRTKSASKTKRKAAPKAKAKAKAKAKKPSRISKKTPKKKTSAGKSRSKGLSVAELFALKKQKEQEAAQAAAIWNQKKDLPPQDQAHPENMETKGGNSGKRSGFGGVRHH